MATQRDNLILIGMPSSGKSTAGMRFAERVGDKFLDCDRLIEAREGMSLSEIIKARGAEGFIRTEERILSSLTAEGTVIATGGSAVYGELAMEHLRKLGKIVYLKIGIEEVKRRIQNFAARGVVMRGNIRTLEELFEERRPLYERYADVTVLCDGLTLQETVEQIAVAAGRAL